MKNIFEIKNNNLSVLINQKGCSLERVMFKNKFFPLMELDSTNLYGKEPSLSGAMVGPYCGRIENGILNIGQNCYNLSQNEGSTHLHGGYKNCSNIDWTAISQSKDSICFLTFLPDGLEGYPGNRKIFVNYRLSNSSIIIEIKAVTDKDTIFNITNHAYWNLSSNFDTKILNHKFKIPTQYVFENTPFNIPTTLLSVKKTSFDFSSYKTLDDNLSLLTPENQILISKGINHGFPASSCSIQGEDLELNVTSDYPHLQFYSGGFLNSKTLLKNGLSASSSCAFAIEPQEINRKEITLNKFQRTIEYRLST